MKTNHHIYQPYLSKDAKSQPAPTDTGEQYRNRLTTHHDGKNHDADKEQKQSQMNCFICDPTGEMILMNYLPFELLSLPFLST